MKIFPIEHEEVYVRFANALRKERVAIKKYDIKTHYLCIMEGIQVIGIVGWQELGTNHIRLKTDYIKKDYRGKSCYSLLWTARMKAIFEMYSPAVMSAYCTPMSLPKYKKEGFIVTRESDNGIAYTKLKMEKNEKL